MITLIFTAVIGLLIAFLAIQNTGQITIHAAHYTFKDIPIYALALGSFLTGLFLATLFNTFDALEGLISLKKKRLLVKEKFHELTTIDSSSKPDSYIPEGLTEKEPQTITNTTLLHRLKHRFSI